MRPTYLEANLIQFQQCRGSFWDRYNTPDYKVTMLVHSIIDIYNSKRWIIQGFGIPVVFMHASTRAFLEGTFCSFF
jgi:hypothetical protein